MEKLNIPGRGPMSTFVKACKIARIIWRSHVPLLEALELLGDIIGAFEEFERQRNLDCPSLLRTPEIDLDLPVVSRDMISVPEVRL